MMLGHLRLQCIILGLLGGIINTLPLMEAVSDMFGMSYGCYMDNASRRDLPYAVNAFNAADTVENCVNACHKQYYRYAGVQNGTLCFCGSSYGDYGTGTCDKFCHSNATQLCGGPISNNIYDTGQRLPGPPETLVVLNQTETSIQIRWTKPLSPNGFITQYRVTAKYVETYSEAGVLPPLSLTYTNMTTSAELLNLHPGTKYNVSVAAQTADGAGVRRSVLAWTAVGEPTEPAAPVVVRRDMGQMVVRLTPSPNENGPVTAYRVVVIGEAGHNSFDAALLTSWDKAQERGLPYYIAAELTRDVVAANEQFVVGDGRTYGGYFNPPLPPGSDTHVTVGVVSTLGGDTRTSYAHAGHEQHGVVVLYFGNDGAGGGGNDDDDGDSSSLVLVLSIFIGVFGFLLLLSIAAYLFLRRKLGRRRRRDTQELSLQGPMIQLDSGYVHDAFVPDDEEEGKKDYYEQLKHQVWSIPRNFLELSLFGDGVGVGIGEDAPRGDDVDSRGLQLLGRGDYGDVCRGTVQWRGRPSPAAVHVIPDGRLSATNKRFMLQDLDAVIRCGAHPSLVALVGTCETPDTLYVVLEHHPASLKDVLLESRSLEHRPRGAELDRFCSLGEAAVLEAALGVARAMDHLAKLKIVHKQLCARNVLMADGVTAKVTGHAITRCARGGRCLDGTRWMAHEVFRSRHHVTKSDVWAFGCLLWEISALGGTPYVSIRTSEIGSRVMHGLRLPQMPFVSDDLYQLMLQCWQMDLDERPTFEELTRVLEDLLADAAVHINFSVFDSFHYEPYIEEFESK